MPNRILRAEILGSDRVDALSPEAEVFYRRLMSIVDDYGRFEADSRTLRSHLWPLRPETISNDQIELWLSECSATLEDEEDPLVTVYQVGRKKFLQINNFRQRIRSESRFPEPVFEERGGASPSSARIGPSSAALTRATNTNTNTPPHTNTNTPPAPHTPPAADDRERKPNGQLPPNHGFAAATARASRPPPGKRPSYATALANGDVQSLEEYKLRYLNP